MRHFTHENKKLNTAEVQQDHAVAYKKKLCQKCSLVKLRHNLS